jgi:hypothetical protein
VFVSFQSIVAERDQLTTVVVVALRQVFGVGGGNRTCMSRTGTGSLSSMKVSTRFTIAARVVLTPVCAPDTVIQKLSVLVEMLVK